MAEDTEAEEKQGGGKGSSMKIIVIALVVVLAGGAGGYFFMSKSDPAAKKDEAGHEEKAAGGQGEEKAASDKKADKDTAAVIHPLDTFIVNLQDSGRTRYLKITVHLELDRPEAAEEVKAKTTQIRDALIILLSSKSLDEIVSTEGKYQLRDEIVARAGQYIKSGKVATAYFTDLVIQ